METKLFIALSIAVCLLSSATATSSSSSSGPTVASAGCLQLQDNLYCTDCDTNNLYYSVGSGCVQSGTSGCVSIDYLGRCIDCAQGYYLKNGQTCTVVSEIVGCLNYATDTATTICLACSSKFMLTQNQCLLTVANCDSYIPATNICAQCSANYTQAWDWCSCIPGTIANCIQYDCMGLCVQCVASLPRLSTKRDACYTSILLRR